MSRVRPVIAASSIALDAETFANCGFTAQDIGELQAALADCASFDSWLETQGTGGFGRPGPAAVLHGPPVPTSSQT